MNILTLALIAFIAELLCFTIYAQARQLWARRATVPRGILAFWLIVYAVPLIAGFCGDVLFNYTVGVAFFQLRGLTRRHITFSERLNKIFHDHWLNNPDHKPVSFGAFFWASVLNAVIPGHIRTVWPA